MRLVLALLLSFTLLIQAALAAGHTTVPIAIAAFFTYHDPKIFLWDGRLTVNISSHFLSYPPVWSQDRRLAWNVLQNGHYHVYVWNTGRAVKITDVSQGEFMTEPVWSEDGRLALIAFHDGSYKIYIWDGQTLLFIADTPDGTMPIWLDSGQLAWNGFYKGQWWMQAWDGEKIISLNEMPARILDYVENDRHELKNGWVVWTSNGDDFLWKPETNQTIDLKAAVGDYDGHPVWFISDEP